MADLNQVVNLFQLEELHPKLITALENYGFAIVPDEDIQFFHVYEKNDYQQFPNFVTTDMYMQLFHMYFGYVLRTVEEKEFIPLLSELTEGMWMQMGNIADTSSDLDIQEAAQFNTVFYAIAHYILTEKELSVPGDLERLYREELSHIEKVADSFSEFLDYKNVEFPYSLFKPRGHYTRNEDLKRYFKAMMWLQTAPFCLDNDVHLKRAAQSAAVLAGDQELLRKYQAILEPVNFIIGQPDNVSFLDLVSVMENSGYSAEQIFNDPQKFNEFRKAVKQIADAQNRIKPKQAMSCVDKINFMPQRYLADNEVLQELVDVESPSSLRPYPKGLDVMAAFGSTSASRVLMEELNEGGNWAEYPNRMTDLQAKMKGVDPDATLYNKWIESLLKLQEPNEKYPYFMQSPQWNKKDLNASLASWAELKHDAILYAEQPMAAECGGGGPPAPITVGYVEPNIAYWKAVIDLIDLTRNVLEGQGLMNAEISRVTSKLKENAEFLLIASQKELAGQDLSENEYSQIELIGSTFEWLTLDLVKNEGEYLNGWAYVSGPDRKVAVVADIYTSNASNNPDKGILHVATGNVNHIYVVVEIKGYLYLTKGAVFGYHEFHLPLGNRLTDEEWQEMLERKQAPGLPEWMQEIIVPIKPPQTNEKIFYSSGC